MSKQANLQIHKLKFAYPKRVVFDGLSINARRGLLCVGSNGSGKSTLLRLIAVLLDANAGSVRLNGRDDYCANAFFDARFLCDAYRVSQHFAWLALYCAEEAIATGDCASALKDAALWSRLVGELSSGERDFVALLLSMASSCEILVFDEPLRQLDQKKRDVFFELLDKRMAKDIFVVLSMHEPLESLTAFEVLSLEL